MSNKKQIQATLVAKNKRAHYDYELSETYEAGMVLKGWQVKSMRQGKVSLENNPYIVVNNKNEVFISGMIINPASSTSTHEAIDTQESVRLLLNKHEINKINAKTEQKGYTVVLTKIYWVRNHLKCEIALAKGKNDSDKRQTIKERDSKRETQRAMKNISL